MAMQCSSNDGECSHPQTQYGHMGNPTKGLNSITLYQQGNLELAVVASRPHCFDTRPFRSRTSAAQTFYFQLMLVPAVISLSRSLPS